MKRFLTFLLALIITLSVCACGDSNAQMEDPVLEAYKSKAQSYIDSGDLETAILVLEEGVSVTGNSELSQMLNDLKLPLSTTVPETTSHTEPPATAPEPTEATEPPTATPNLVDKFTPEEQREINIFLSSLAEQRFSIYPTDTLHMLDFAFLYCKLNYSSSITQKHWGMNMYHCVSENTINEILWRFFGTGIYGGGGFGEQFGSTNFYYWYTNNEYWVFDSENASHNYVAIVTDMVENVDGNYNVVFQVYAINTYGSLSNYYSMDLEQIQFDDLASYVSSGNAEISLVDGSYRILSYRDNIGY